MGVCCISTVCTVLVLSAALPQSGAQYALLQSAQRCWHMRPGWHYASLVAAVVACASCSEVKPAVGMLGGRPRHSCACILSSHMRCCSCKHLHFLRFIHAVQLLHASVLLVVHTCCAAIAHICPDHCSHMRVHFLHASVLLFLLFTRAVLLLHASALIIVDTCGCSSCTHPSSCSCCSHVLCCHCTHLS
jgi:hypothetical protein